MKTINYFTNKFRFLTNLRTRSAIKAENNTTLTNPRFELDLKITSKNKKGVSSLLSQMYSEENNALFI